MQPSFSEMPKFQTPEEELDYLRAHISRQSQELVNAGHTENVSENAARNVIEQYKEVPITQALHKDSIIQEKEKEAIVLKLKPEPHDGVMEELLGLVITKGIKNAFAVVDAMNNPHIDDDFHRLLIQYLKTGQVDLGFKEGS